MRQSTLTLTVLLAFGFLSQAEAAPANDVRILEITASSSCAAHDFKKRGRPPKGLIAGTALLYSKRYCELKRHANAIVAQISGVAPNKSRDALELYNKAAGTPTERLRALFALGIGEAMRESSGNFTEGFDKTVSDPTAETAEAGLFQVSHDSINDSPLLQQVIDEYTRAPQACLVDTFQRGIKDRKTAVIGDGPGAEFQTRMKSCPALAMDYGLIMLRVNRAHFGPIKRKEAELLPECEILLHEIEVETDRTCP